MIETDSINQFNWADIKISRELDLTAYYCPMPLLKTKLALNSMNEGQVLKVITKDRASLRDFPSFTKTNHHILLYSGENDNLCIHLLRKGKRV